MTFLPVIERELRTAARKPSTFWMRVSTAAVALGLGTLVGMLRSFGGVNAAMLGQFVFATLTWGSLLVALAAGLFLTSDSLSEEKREGTLGFLFLTDLKGYDIVGGKLFASSLRAFYALLAIFPIVAMTLLMGGVTGLQLWKTMLSLINALLFSLSVGMFVSCFSRNAQKALSTTLLLLILLSLGGPLVDTTVTGITKGGFRPVASLASPGFLLTQADGALTQYWLTFLVNQAITWLLFGIASLFLPRTWQQRTIKAAAGAGAYAWKYGGTARRKIIRDKWLSIDPIVWLSTRERWLPFGIWVVALFGLLCLAVAALARVPRTAWFGWGYFGWIYNFVFYLWTASQASRFFFDMRQSGMLELLLSTPLAEQEIVSGRWRGLRRILGIPLLIFVVVHASGTILYFRAFSGAIGGGVQAAISVFQIIAAVSSVVSIVANVVALCWFGMWMGMISKSGNVATLRTYLFVQVVPGVGISILSSMLFFQLMRYGGTNAVSYFPLNSVISSLMVIAKDLIFVVWSRNRLRQLVRLQAGIPIGSRGEKSRLHSVSAWPPDLAQSAKR